VVYAIGRQSLVTHHHRRQRAPAQAIGKFEHFSARAARDVPGRQCLVPPGCQACPGEQGPVHCEGGRGRSQNRYDLAEKKLQGDPNESLTLMGLWEETGQSAGPRGLEPHRSAAAPAKEVHLRIIALMMAPAYAVASAEA
jgi:hypothetical protein